MAQKRSFTVSDLPQSERPRERLRKFGAQVLSEQELIAAVLGRGGAGKPVLALAHELLYRFGGLNGIAEASIEQLTEINGIGLAKAAQLKAAVEVARRLGMSRAEEKDRPVRTAQDVAQLAREKLRDWNTEQFLVIALSTRGKVNRVVRCDEISRGSLNSTVVHPREVFDAAIRARAAAVIFVHNHPSGDPEPSDDDIALTRRLVSAGQVMGIPVHDHVIVTERQCVSLRARNLI